MNGLLNTLSENIILSQKKVENLKESISSLEEKINVMQNLSITLNPNDVKTVLSVSEDLMEEVLKQSYDSQSFEEVKKQMQVIRYFIPQMESLELSLTSKQENLCKEFIENFMYTLRGVNTSHRDVKKLLDETEKKLEFDKQLKNDLKNLTNYVSTDLLNRIDVFLERQNISYQSKINMIISILDYNDSFYIESLF